MAAAFSVIIPAYNCSDIIRRALDSVLAQTHPPLEVLVVDDGSADSTADVVAAYGPPVRCIRQANQGPAGARNRGIDEARGEWVCFLDSDDTWYPRKLQRQAELAAAAPEVGVMFCDWHNRNESGEILCEGFSDPNEKPSPRDLPRREVAPGLFVLTGDAFGPLLESFFIHTNTLAVRRDVLGSLRYDARFNWGEDWLFWLDLARVARFGFVDEVLTEYKERAGSICKRSNMWSMVSRYEVAKAPLTRYGKLPPAQHQKLYRWIRQWGSTYGYRLLDDKNDLAAARGVWREAASLRPGGPDTKLRLMAMTPGWLLRAVRGAKRRLRG